MVDLARVQRALLDVHRADEADVAATLDVIAHVVTGAVEECRWASLVVLHDDAAGTIAFRGTQALAVDEAQVTAGAGPSIEAARTGRPVVVDDAGAEDRWSEFARAAAAQGVASSASVPFRADDGPPGCLNLYGDRPGAFTPDVVEAATLIAAHAEVAVANLIRLAGAEADNDHLRVALSTRDVIGQAKGILMSSLRLTEDDAFDHLRRVSQDANLKLRDVAATVTRTGSLAAVDRTTGR